MSPALLIVVRGNIKILLSYALLAVADTPTRGYELSIYSATPIIFWILKSIGSAILGWITWCILDRFREAKSKTEVDTDIEKEVS